MPNEISGVEKGELAQEIEISTLEKNKKIGLYTFISMIFVTVYGIGNSQQIYYQMGYASITYVILGIFLFLIPYAFMVSEMSSAFHNKTGGIFSWMSESVGLKFSTVGVFLWYVAAIIWWLWLSAIAINISTAIFGVDESQSWHIFGLSNTGTTALIGVAFFSIIIFFSRLGIKSVGFLSNISMLVVIILHIVLLGGGILIFILNHGHFQQHFDFTKVSSYFYGPNKYYANPMQAIAFMVFIIFILGGLEATGGLVDKIHNPKKTAPKAMLLAAFSIAFLYVFGVIVLGMVLNYKQTFGNPHVNMFNFSIYLILQQFTEFGLQLGMSHANAVELGKWVNRVLTWTTLIGMFNLPLVLYYPIKQVFEGMPKGMVPSVLLKKNKHGVTTNALYLQSTIIIIAVLLIGFGGNVANTIYNNIVFMMTIATSIPWLFIVYAYIKFKQNDSIKKEYTFFSKKWGIIVGTITCLTLLFVNVFSMVEPFFTNQIQQGIWVVSGPIAFGILGYILAEVYLYKHDKSKSLLRHFSKKKLTK
ncbi:MAG: glutamate/gamma-aminobutyrate family transporter YjeM [Psittacicella sp.]